MNKDIAFFDFDGTVTTKDTMLNFLKFLVGKRKYYYKMLILTPVFTALKVKFITNHQAKEIMLRYFIGGKKENEIQHSGIIFCRNILPSLIRVRALEAIKVHQSNMVEVVIVSASAEYWLKNWCDEYGLKLIATRLSVVNGNLTGKINGINCYGIEKVERIRSTFNLDKYENIFCYGDTEGDLPMLSLATKSFYKPFRD